MRFIYLFIYLLHFQVESGTNVFSITRELICSGTAYSQRRVSPSLEAAL